MNTLYAFRRIIIDIHDQLEDMYVRRINEKLVIHLYRRQPMSREDVLFDLPIDETLAGAKLFANIT